MWLYPIHRGTSFAVGSWRSKRSGAEGFAEMIRHDGTNDKWVLKVNFRKVSKGDDIVVYASKPSQGKPPLIIGFGTVVAAPYKDGADHRIEIKWDIATSLALAKTPVDATWLADELPATKPTVTAIPDHLWAELRDRLLRTQKPGPGRDEAADGEIRIPASKAMRLKVKARAYDAFVRHDAHLVVPLRARLEKHGWLPLLTSADGVRADYLAVAPDGSAHLLVEAKTLVSDHSDGRNEIRFALGQLHDYEHFVVRNHHGIGGTVERMIFLERAPAAKLVTFIESLGVCIGWRRGKTFELGPITSTRLGRWLEEPPLA